MTGRDRSTTSATRSLAVDIGDLPLRHVSRSSGVTSPELSLSMMAQAVARTSP
jgi:hypothetical protein